MSDNQNRSFKNSRFNMSDSSQNLSQSYSWFTYLKNNFPSMTLFILSTYWLSRIRTRPSSCSLTLSSVIRSLNAWSFTASIFWALSSFRKSAVFFSMLRSYIFLTVRVVPSRILIIGRFFSKPFFKIESIPTSAISTILSVKISLKTDCSKAGISFSIGSPQIGCILRKE